MELKFFMPSRISQSEAALIEPYGIEINSKNCNPQTFWALIEPYGIEIRKSLTDLQHHCKL